MVTGANGFVGVPLCASLRSVGYQVNAVTRDSVNGDSSIQIGNIGPETKWAEALRPQQQPLGGHRGTVDIVIHLAARVHVMNDDKKSERSQEYTSVNTEGTLNLAKQAADAGVRRFIYLSTIKVNGEGQALGGCTERYDELSVPSPEGPYAISKWEAEQGLRDVERSTGMEVVILRPPLVYGPGVGANFLQLLRYVDKGLPLPFGAVSNRRSLLFLGNLVDAIVLCVGHPSAAGGLFLLSDGADMSTPALIRKLGQGLGKPVRIWSIPPKWLLAAGNFLGKKAQLKRLFGSLIVDSNKIVQELGWVRPYSVDQALAVTADWFRQSKSGGR